MKELWALDQVKELDFPSPTGFMKVKDFLPLALEEVRADASGQYSILRNSLLNNGWLVPIRISGDKRRLRDGIHRTAIASDLGWNSILVSDARHTNVWDISEEGQKYWELWYYRLRGLRSA